jgi:soluble lytic murein transglycosylase-like protein
LRLPTRLRGVALGLAVLVISPIVIATGRHAPVAVASRPTDAVAQAPADASKVAKVVAINDPELQFTDPTPAPTPVPTPVPTPRPTARPTANIPTAPPPAPGTIQAIIQQAAAANGVSYPWMLKIAQCESGLNPHAYNPAGPYYGLFQFLMSTFRANGGTDIWDPVQQANITARMLAHGQAHQWGCA